MTKEQVKTKIKAMKKYDINQLNNLANKSGIPLMTIGFWYSAIHS